MNTLTETTQRIELPPKLIPIFTGNADIRGAWGGRGSGKCLGRGVRLLRYDTSIVAVEDVKIGDLLLGPNGLPRTVLSVTRGMGPLYRIDQKTGLSYVCNDAHILTLERSGSSENDFGSYSAAGNPQRPNGRYFKYVNESNGYSLITAQEYAEKPERFKAQHFGFRRAIIKPHKDDLPIDPYLLGLWLGDGSSAVPEITNIDPEVVQYIYKIAKTHESWTVTKQDSKDKAPRYYIGSKYSRYGSFFRQLRNANLLNNKHIPETYFSASIEQRRALLAGLIDTDGHVQSGYIAISQANERIADDIRRLAFGLGYKASKTFKMAKSSNGKLCQSWAIQIGGDINHLPLLIARKRKAAQVDKNKDWRRTRVDATPIGIGEYFGFELDGDHLFMLEDGTVTHNTRNFAKMTAVRAFMWAEAGREGIILCGRQFMNSLADSSLEEIKAAIKSEPWLASKFEIGEKYVKTANGNISYAFAGLDRNIDSIKSKSRILLGWVDEGEPVVEEAWQKLIPTLREEDSELWVTWNPESKRSATHRRFRLASDPLMKITQMNWRDNPWFPNILERVRLKDKKERPESYEHIWEGEFATVFAGAYYTKELIDAREAGRIGSVGYEPELKVHTAWDLGIGDSTAIWFFQVVGSEVRVIDFYENHGKALTHYVEVLEAKPYTYDKDFVPHDAKVRELGTGLTRVETLIKLDRNPVLIANHKVEDGINAVRRILPHVWFDEERCEYGLDCLRQYRTEFDENAQVFYDKPRHDFSSHAADSFRYLAMAYEDMTPEALPEPKPIKGLHEATLDDIWDDQPTGRRSGGRI